MVGEATVTRHALAMVNAMTVMLGKYARWIARIAAATPPATRTSAIAQIQCGSSSGNLVATNNGARKLATSAAAANERGTCNRHVQRQLRSLVKRRDASAATRHSNATVGSRYLPLFPE